MAVHGIPDLRSFAPGDLVSIDLAGRRNRFCADAAWTYALPPISPATRQVLAAAWQCCSAGVQAGASKRRLSAIGRAVQQKSLALNCAQLPRFGGHGIGRHLHEAPLFAFVDAVQAEDVLTEGMVVNIEPVLCQSACEALLAADGWSWTCPPGILSAQFELSLALMPDAESEVLNFSEQQWLHADLPPFY